MTILHGAVGRVRPARFEDIEPIRNDLRDSDVRELRDGIGSPPFPALIQSFEKSGKCFTITVGDAPVAMFGVAPHLFIEEFGVAWYLATNRWDREGTRDMLAHSPFFIDLMSQGFGVIGNLIDSRNRRSLKWLKHLGFREGMTFTGTASGLPFILMYKETS